ncbi:MAG: BcsR/BcsP family cellulose biosynthesis protein [Alphaproteobacteria bacterium]
MTIEKTRLTQSLGMPDLKLKEIVEEQRLLDAASRWPILNDLVRAHEPARREISVNLARQEKRIEAEQGIINLRGKRGRRSVFGSEVPADPRVKAVEAASEPVEAVKPTHQLSNVFLRLKHREKPAPKAKTDNKLVTV